MTPQDVVRVLEEVFHAPGWTVTKLDSWSNTAFVAQHDRRRVFVKFDVSIPILERVAALRIAPRLLKSGHDQGRAYVIQQYIDRSYPDRRWLVEHRVDIARLVRRFHHDDRLEELLAEERGTHAEQRPLKQAHELGARVEGSQSQLFKSTVFVDALRVFQAQAERLQEIVPVPTHGDLTRKNFLLSDPGFFVADWDEARLADPLRDVGPFLWWYLPRNRWDDFLAAFGERKDEGIINRLFWWVSRASLDIALSLVERGYSEERARDFVEDFAAAVRGQDNPHYEPP